MSASHNSDRMDNYIRFKWQFVNEVARQWQSVEDFKLVEIKGLICHFNKLSEVISYILRDGCDSRNGYICLKCIHIFPFTRSTISLSSYEYIPGQIPTISVINNVLLDCICLKCSNFAQLYLINAMEQDVKVRSAFICKHLEEFMLKHMTQSVARYIDWE